MIRAVLFAAASAVTANAYTQEAMADQVPAHSSFLHDFKNKLGDFVFYYLFLGVQSSWG